MPNRNKPGKDQSFLATVTIMASKGATGMHMGNSKPILPKAKPHNYLSEHIPYRLTAIDAFCFLNLDWDSTATLVRNSLIDTAFIHSRSLWDLLGIKFDKSSIVKGACQPDICVSSTRAADVPYAANLKFITGIEALEIHPDEVDSLFLAAGYNRANHGKRPARTSLAEFLRVASKGVAHLTKDEQRTFVESDYLASVVLIGTVIDAVYGSTGQVVPDFDQWTCQMNDMNRLADHRQLIERVRLKACKNRNNRQSTTGTIQSTNTTVWEWILAKLNHESRG